MKMNESLPAMTNDNEIRKPFNHECGNQDLFEINHTFWYSLRLLIKERNHEKFQQSLDEQDDFCKIASLKPRLINETLLDCLCGSSKTPLHDPTVWDGCDFIEALMRKLHTSQCYFISWDDTCKSIVRVFIAQQRQFTQFTLCFLLRCFDLTLIKSVFDSELVDVHCLGNCQNWHLMFVASYQERFFTSSIDNIFEGFMCRFVLLCKLRCLLEQKRSFLTWFAGSLHLYADEYFLQSDEGRFKQVLAELFRGLILNGLLSDNEFKNFYQMLVKRNKEMLSVLYSNSAANQANNAQFYFNNTKSNNSNDCLNKSNSKCYFPHLDSLFPLSLKNICRLVIKQKMTKYTRASIECLPLPNNLKKFIFFEIECDNAYKCCNVVANNSN